MRRTDKLYEKICDTYYSQITVDVYIAGNSEKGESILVLLRSTSNVLHSLLIDSFIGENGYNPLIDILDKYQVDHIDTLVWTHPHEDHTSGMMNILSKYGMEIDDIVIPMSLSGCEKAYRGEVKEVFEFIKKISLANIEDKSLPSIIDVNANTSIINSETIMLKDEDEDLEFSIYSVAPIGNVVRNRTYKDSYMKLNDFSIALYYVIGDLVIFLTGDIENLTINQMDRRTIDKMILPNYLKLPHHGSNGSNNLVKIIQDEKEKASCCMNITSSTAYYDHGLPTEEIISSYMQLSESLFVIDKASNGKDAIFHTSIDVIKREITTPTVTNYVDLKDTAVT